MAQIINNIPVGVLEQGVVSRWTEDYQESNGPDGTSCVATIETDWSEDMLTSFPSGMIGTAKTVGNKVSRKMPTAHPVKNFLYCTRCDLSRGRGFVTEEAGAVGSIKFDTNSTNEEAKAAWNVQWDYLGYDLASDRQRDAEGGTGKELIRFVSRKVKASVESLPVPGTEWKFQADNEEIPEGATILIALKELQYTWHRVPFPYKESTWDGMLGKVNTVAFDGKTKVDVAPAVTYPSYAIGTVYFQGYEASDPFVDPEGNIINDVTFVFLYRRQGWNNFYRPGQGFVAVVSLDGARTPFSTADLLTIFD